MNKNFKKYSAYYLGSLLERKKIDPIALLEYFILNFKKSLKDQKLSFTKVFMKEALIEANQAWKRQKKNERLSYFDGIPIVWKDLIDIQGYPAFAGSKLIKNIRRNQLVKNAEIVTLAKKNGLVTLAKTSTVEFAFGGLGINNSYKLPKNLMFSKQNLAPGGSSTGSATAVYSGLAPMSVGTDTAGSVRIPAAWHSLVGFKPSYRKISTKGVLPLSKSFDTVGTICKSVKDTQLLFNILSNKRYNFNLDFSKNVSLASIENINFPMLDYISKSKIEELKIKISKLGMLVKNIKIPEFEELNDLVASYGSLVNYEAWKSWKNTISYNIKVLDSNVADRFLIGREIKPGLAIVLKKKIMKLKLKALSKLTDYDFYIIPTVSMKPPPLKSLENKGRYHYFNNLVLNNTRAANIFDLCAVSIPIFFKKRKWLSISVISRKNNEENLLAVAEKIESILR